MLWICSVSSATMQGMDTLFCGAALAARIERVEAQFIAAATEAARRRGAELRMPFVTQVADGAGVLRRGGLAAQ